MAEAHEAIRNLLGRYCELVDAGDWPGLGELFSDARLCDEAGTPWATGRDEVIASWEKRTQMYDGSPRTRHLTVNPIIEVDDAGGTATARAAYVVFQATDALPLQPVITGRYRDTFARDATAEWRFTERRYSVDQAGDLSHHLLG